MNCCAISLHQIYIPNYVGFVVERVLLVLAYVFVLV